MPKCPQCENGYRQVEEDGRRFVDACYHCGNTGFISDEQLASDQVRWAAGRLSEIMVDRQRAWANANPDGEGWAFHAAENMCSEYDYTEGVRWGLESEAMKALGTLEPKALHSLVFWILSWRSGHRDDPSTVDRAVVEALDDKFRSVKEVILDELDGKVWKPPVVCGRCYMEEADCECLRQEPTPAEPSVQKSYSDLDDEIPF